jgi:hypothetical protein
MAEQPNPNTVPAPGMVPVIDPRGPYLRVEDQVDEYPGLLPRSQPGHPRSLDPISRHSRKVNRLSTAGIDELMHQMTTTGRLAPMTVKTGNTTLWRRDALLSRYVPQKAEDGEEAADDDVETGSVGYGHVTPRKDGIAQNDLKQWHAHATALYAANPLDMPKPKGGPTPPIPVAHVVWRHMNRDENGNCRFLVAGLEVSHQASAYDMYPFPAHPFDLLDATPRDAPDYAHRWVRAAERGPAANRRPFAPPYVAPQKGWRIELVQLESQAMQTSRGVCATFSLMWYKPDGSLIRPDEYYTGETQCPHQRLHPSGRHVCYGPPPGLLAVDAEAPPPEPPYNKRQRVRLSEQAAALPVEEEAD